MKKLIVTIIIFLTLGNTSISQESNYELRIEELRKELGYKENTKRAVRLRENIRAELEKPIEDDSEAIVPPGVIQFFKFLGYILIIIIVGAVILLMLKFIRPRLNSQQQVPSSGDTMNNDEIEDIGNLNIETLLEAALRKGDYRAAIRALFLRNIQILNTQKSIYWQKHKTNRDYLRESRGQKHFDSFLTMVTIYERVWYGSNDIDADTYQSLSPEFGSSLLKPDYHDGQ